MGARVRSWWQKIKSRLVVVRRRWLSWWQKIKQHPYATGVVVFLVLILFILSAYRFGWDWSGFNSQENKTTTVSTPLGTYRATEVQPAKNLWDWLGLLAVLAIPVVVGLGAAWFTVQQGKVSDRENTDNQREAALQAYIDKISKLLLKEHLGELTEDGKLKPEYEQVRKIARVRTITILSRLDSKRKGSVLQFLYESGLIEKERCILDLSGANLSRATLRFANLRNANLHGVDLSGADLWQANMGYADLSGADLSEAKLRYANLLNSNLREVNLIGADPSNANFNGANLRGARLHSVNFSGANLSEANLSEATLYNANLSYAHLNNSDLSAAYLNKANLNSANLTEANLIGTNLSRTIGITPEQLDKAKSLKGATMPDGSIHP